MNCVKYYLLEYNNSSHTGEWSEFEDGELAFESLNARERTKRPEEEVVLFMAESLDALKLTHPRFFGFPGRLMLREDSRTYVA